MGLRLRSLTFVTALVLLGQPALASAPQSPPASPGVLPIVLVCGALSLATLIWWLTKAPVYRVTNLADRGPGSLSAAREWQAANKNVGVK